MIDLNRAMLKTGELSWYVIKRMGSRYLMLTSSVIYEGFYNERPCDYLESRANMFLQRKFMALVEHEGIDPSKISNVGFLSTGQYERYVRGRLPNVSHSFLLETPANNAGDRMSCVLDNGEIGAVSIWDSVGFRPCIYIDSTYFNDMFSSASTVDELFEEEKRLLKEQAQGKEREQESNESLPERKEGDESVAESIPADISTVSLSESESPDSVRGSGSSSEDIENDTEKHSAAPDGSVVKAGAQKCVQNETSSDVEIPDKKESDGVSAENISGVLPDAVIKKTNSDVCSVYRYRDEFERFADVIEGGEEEVKNIVAERSAISDFIKNSQSERKKVDTSSMMDLIVKQQNRWRWNN